jgi:uncharacterized protein YjbI with pentapeptide repeats
VAATNLTFAGKLAYGNGQSTPAFLDVVARGRNPTYYLPVMTGQGRAADFPCIVYSKPDGTFRVQLTNLMWVMLYSELGILMLTDDATKASALKLSGSPLGQTWQIDSGSGYLDVGYDSGTPQPQLTTNLGSTPFSPTVVTPSVPDIITARTATNADLSNVLLDGVSIPNVDFTGAQFVAASLVGAKLPGCTLKGANFTDAQLGGISLDGATLDTADMTGATLGPPSWGAPKSAKGLVLSQCKAAGAILGGQTNPLDCQGAILADGDFTGANLRKLDLTKAKAARAILVGADLTNAVLDGADLGNAVATGAVMRQASMKNVRAQGAVFIGADLSGADLGQAQLGAKAYLFQIASSLASDLDKGAYPTEAVISAFATYRTLSPQAPISVIAKGQRWEIADPNGPYLLIAVAAGIDVFLAADDMTPATLQRAVCLGTKASGAGLAGVDLRGAAWYGSGATLDHADLEGAYLSDSLCAATDFTQAFLSGADLSGAVLAQAVFRGCQIGPGAGRQAFSLEGAQLQGCNFKEANLLGALLPDAAVSTPQGVPLFKLPASDKQNLTPSGISKLIPAFNEAGYSLGAKPTVSSVSTWLIDNSSDPITSDPRSYLVRSSPSDLKVFNGDTNVFCFSLASSYANDLKKKNPTSMLINAFAAQNFGLVATAVITAGHYWTIKAGADAVSTRRYYYQQFTVTDMVSALPVFGSTLLILRDWPQYPAGLAFSGTNGIDAALSPNCIGPSGLPKAWVSSGQLSLLDFLTART